MDDMGYGVMRVLVTGAQGYLGKQVIKSLSEINIKKSIISQINIIRTRDNQKFPSYFFYKKRKYFIKLTTK